MFANSFTLLRRLIGKAESEPKEVKADERRLWIRYPADLKTSVQLADHPGEDRLPARIRDISRGGANLIIDTAFQAGQVLSLELPSPEDPEKVFYLLACVVRSTPEQGGRHSLGCVFSRELSDDDLFTFGARRVRHAPEDQRIWMRFPCQLTAAFVKVGELDAQPRTAQIINISASGVGLEVNEQIHVGALLNLKVVGKQGHERTLLACVVHSLQQGETWQLGCNFIRELSETDFQDLT